MYLETHKDNEPLCKEQIWIDEDHVHHQYTDAVEEGHYSHGNKELGESRETSSVEPSPSPTRVGHVFNERVILGYEVPGRERVGEFYL